MPVVCACGAHNSINFTLHMCVECGRVHRYMWVCGKCMNGYNGACETCDENDRVARAENATQKVCAPVERVRLPTRKSPAVKETRFPDRFNVQGKKRTSPVDKYAANKRATTNKSKDRALLRRIKFGFDEPADIRIGKGLTVHDVQQYSWEAAFAVRNLTKRERENALRKGGSSIYTYGCACVRQAWKEDHPHLVAGTSFLNDKCIGCTIPQTKPFVVQNILNQYSDDFAHDDSFYVWGGK